MLHWADIKRKIKALAFTHNTPEEIALGVAIGVMIGIMPLYGFHTLLVIFFALLVRRSNKIAILIGTNISLPPTVPFITWVGYNIGRLIFWGKYPEISWSMLKTYNYKNIWSLYMPLFVGSLVLGVVCAGISYYFVWAGVKKWKKSRSLHKEI